MPNAPERVSLVVDLSPALAHALADFVVGEALPQIRQSAETGDFEDERLRVALEYLRDALERAGFVYG